MRNRAVSRPAWSLGAFHRKVQTSPHALHIVVEGKTHDRSFYGRIAESHPSIRDRGYQVTCVETLHSAGGKAGVLAAFDSMRRASRLIQHVASGRRVVVFMLDRDAENIVGGSRRNPHIFYTRGYDVESDIFNFGNDSAALSYAAGLSPVEAELLARKLGDWQRQAALHWRRWLVLCCISKKLGVSCRASFGRGTVSDSDLSEISRCRADIKRISGITSNEFHQLEQSFLRKVDSAFKRGEHDCLTKGKWLPFYLKNRIVIEFGGVHACDLNGFEKRVVSNYLSTIKFDQVWVDRYTRSWLDLLEEHGRIR